MQFTILRGDCLARMKEMADNSVDSIVTDPPYELSNDGKQSPAGVFLEFAFPQNAKIEAHRSGGCELAGLVGEILNLSYGWVIPRPAAPMPVVAVAFDDQSALGQKNVEHASESAIGVTAGSAVGDVETQAPQHLGCFSLKFTDRAKMLQVLHEVGAGFISGGLGVGTAAGAARFPSLAPGLASIVGGDDVIWAIDDALANLVSAASGAARGAVLGFDLAGGSVETFTADGALLFAAVLREGGAQLVRTRPAASSLSTMLEARRVRVVDDATGGAFTFDLIVHLQSVASMGFMGKAWDGSKIAFNVEMWREALRVLKPGGHLLAFSGSRTYHRMAVAIEDAGFEIRDQAMWLYGSGFPKSNNVSKSIDKEAGAVRSKIRVDASDLKNPPDLVGGVNNGSDRPWRLAAMEAGYHEKDSDEPATEAARQWQGWGTALKPAHEPICVARKPLIGTVAANVLAFGTGALNIDGCRVEVTDAAYARNCSGDRGHNGTRTADEVGSTNVRAGGGSAAEGRWPANIIHDGSDEVLALFPEQQSGSRAAGVRTGMGFHGADGDGGPAIEGSSGSAARFFYCAKASRADRNAGCEHMAKKPLHWSSGDANPGSFQSKGTDKSSQNNHPTVKPTALMAYLVRLVTPPGGLVLDPFMGSGSTGKACMREGFRFIGIELSDEYADIAEARITQEMVGDLL